jgi:hypothetical protein
MRRRYQRKFNRQFLLYLMIPLGVSHPHDKHIDEVRSYAPASRSR